jgi:hypothetical protein
MVMGKKEHPSGSSCKLLKVRDLRLNQVAPEAKGNIFLDSFQIRKHGVVKRPKTHNIQRETSNMSLKKVGISF